MGITLSGNELLVGETLQLKRRVPSPRNREITTWERGVDTMIGKANWLYTRRKFCVLGRVDHLLAYTTAIYLRMPFTIKTAVHSHM